MCLNLLIAHIAFAILNTRTVSIGFKHYRLKFIAHTMYPIFLMPLKDHEGLSTCKNKLLNENYIKI